MKTLDPLSFVLAPLAGALLAALALPAGADAITDWNQRSAQIVAEARIGTPPAFRVMALVQTAAYEAARDESHGARPGAQAVDVAIAAAHCTAFIQLLPAQRAAIDAAFQAAVAAMPDDAAWTPLIDPPMHPEYPCAHCTVAATLAAMLKAEERGGPLPALGTASPAAQGTVRGWNSPEAFVQEVALARIVAGVHYRSSIEAGVALGQRIGEWALARSRNESGAQ